jgi:hypothetical protein
MGAAAASACAGKADHAEHGVADSEILHVRRHRFDYA